MAPRAKAKKQLITAEEWARDYGGQLARKVIEALMKQRQLTGPSSYRMMTLSFLAGFISAFLNVSMRECPTESETESFDELAKNAEETFQDIKAGLQDAVSAGFQAGIFSWTGQTVEYYTLIKPIPEVVNKRPC